MGTERNEMSDYINMKVTRDTDMTHFWLEKKSVLPKLFTVFRKVLCIPASSAASERVFSTAGRLLEKRRTSLSSTSVNSLFSYTATCSD